MTQELVQTIYRQGGIILALDTSLLFQTGQKGRFGSTIDQDGRLRTIASTGEAFLTPTSLVQDECDVLKKTWGLCHLPLPVVRFADIYRFLRQGLVEWPLAERAVLCPACQQRAIAPPPASTVLVPAKRSIVQDDEMYKKRQRTSGVCSINWPLIVFFSHKRVCVRRVWVGVWMCGCLVAVRA